MPLINVVVILIVIGVALALVNKFVAPYMAAALVKIMNVVVVIAVVLWLLGLFGIWTLVNTVRVR